MGHILVVDLNNGTYVQQFGGHERFNMDKNADGNYYGYVPPHCSVNIDALGASRNDEYVENILVVYVQNINNTGISREIIGFCTNARVYRNRQSGDGLGRSYKNNQNQHVTAAWCIKSDNMTDLRSVENKFVIPTRWYNAHMFRGQRSTLEAYPELKQRIVDYINSYVNTVGRIDTVDNVGNGEPDTICIDSDDTLILGQKEINQDLGIEHENIQKAYVVSNDDVNVYGNSKEIDQDLGIEQENIQKAHVVSNDDANVYDNSNDEIVQGTNGDLIKRNPSIARKVLQDSGYKCLCDSSHITFNTTRGVDYMEGHHIIPCTVANSQMIQATYGSRLDRQANIVCLCPTCHRKIHFGDRATKESIIEDLYNKQSQKLKDAGIDISLQELKELYI